MKAVIDRFEEDKAVIILEPSGQQIVWPKEELPPNAKEGDVILITASIPAGETEERRKESREIIDRLTGNG